MNSLNFSTSRATKKLLSSIFFIHLFMFIASKESPFCVGKAIAWEITRQPQTK
jgi:hypothetical protein